MGLFINCQPAPKRLTFFITNSIGELDVLLPVICRLGATNYNYHVIFLVRSIFEKYKSNHFYQKVFGLLNIKCEYVLMPNKFDNRDNSGIVISYIAKACSGLMSNTYGAFKLYRLVKKSDLAFHEFSCQINSVKLLYKISHILGKRIFVYIHGHACQMDTKLRKVNYCTRDAHLLIFHKHSSHVYRKMGYEKQLIIGYPKFYPEWEKFVRKYFFQNNFSERYVLIFTRPISAYYMDEQTYSDLLLESFSAVYECLGDDTLIVVKPHPREDVVHLKDVLLEYKGRYVISQVDSYVLSLHAIIAISFWTSAILSSLSLKVPSVEFYREAKKFRDIEPDGSAYKKLGVDSVDNKDGLKRILVKLISKKEMEFSKIAKSFYEESNVNLDNLFGKYL